jgi:hypothetical protein
MVEATPERLRVRMYNVGFGDCFLLSFTYPAPLPSATNAADRRPTRHILIDFGSTSRPRNRQTVPAVAKQLREDCAGRLDAIVVTHRHRDHLSAFGSKASSSVLAQLDPQLVVRPWTENPRLPPDAGQIDGAALQLGGSADHVYLARLRHAQDLAAKIVERARTAGRGGQTDLVKLAEDDLSNDEAVTTLNHLSRGSRGEYLSAGRATRLSLHVPGVSFRVLGPPRPRQWRPVETQVRESDEFWLGADRQISRLFTRPRGRRRAVPLGTARWIIGKMVADERQQVTGLVRWLDDALNNTSVILLMEVGRHALLFGGDAQIENWGWALNRAKKDPALREALTRVDLYKVGHHGSRNATPRSLYQLWVDRRATQFVSLLSTKSKVHGSGEHTVPRPTLVKALRELGPLLSTDEEDANWIEVNAVLPDGEYKISQSGVPR